MGQQVAVIAGGLAMGVSFLSLAGSGSGLAGASEAASSGHSLTITKVHIAKVGTVLTTSAGLTLYRFTADPMGKATCTGQCAKVWPPVLVPKGDKIKAPHGLKDFSTIRLAGGKRQLAFHGVALYRFSGDKHKGAATGQGVEGTWFAAVASNAISNSPTTAATQPNSATAPSTPSSPSSTPSTTATSPTSTSTTKAPTTPKPVTTTTTKASGPAPTVPVTTSPPPPTTTTSPPTTTTTSPPPTGGVGF